MILRGCPKVDKYQTSTCFGIRKYCLVILSLHHKWWTLSKLWRVFLSYFAKAMFSFCNRRMWTSMMTTTMMMLMASLTTQTSSTISFNSLSDIRSPIRRRTVPSSCKSLFSDWWFAMIKFLFVFYYWLVHQHSLMLFFVGIDFLYQHSGPRIGAYRISKGKFTKISPSSLFGKRKRSIKVKWCALDTGHWTSQQNIG